MPAKKTTKKKASPTRSGHLFDPIENLIVWEVLRPRIQGWIENGDLEDLADLLSLLREELGVNASMDDLQRWLKACELEVETRLVYKDDGGWSHEARQQLSDPSQASASRSAPDFEDGDLGLDIRGAGEELQASPGSRVDLSGLLNSGGLGAPVGGAPSSGFSVQPLPKPK